MNVFITFLKVFKFFSSTLLRLCSGQCSVGEYQCTVGSTCVPAAQLCDGVPHCYVCAQVSAVSVSTSVQWAALVSLQPNCATACHIVRMVLMKTGMLHAQQCLLQLVCVVLHVPKHARAEHSTDISNSMFHLSVRLSVTCWYCVKQP